MKKSNRQRVYEYMKAVNNKPKTGVFVTINVNDAGEIVGDPAAFFADQDQIGGILEGEIVKRIPAPFLNGWLAGRGVRKKRTT